MSRLKSKKRPKNGGQAQGQALVETLFTLPLFLALLFFAIQISFVTLSKRLVSWACFTLARELLPPESKNNKNNIQRQEHATLSARRILATIPFQKTPPLIHVQDFKTEVSVHIQEVIYIWKYPYDIQDTLTLYR